MPECSIGVFHGFQSLKKLWSGSHALRFIFEKDTLQKNSCLRIGTGLTKIWPLFWPHKKSNNHQPKGLSNAVMDCITEMALRVNFKQNNAKRNCTWSASWNCTLPEWPRSQFLCGQMLHHVDNCHSCELLHHHTTAFLWEIWIPAHEENSSDWVGEEAMELRCPASALCWPAEKRWETAWRWVITSQRFVAIGLRSIPFLIPEHAFQSRLWIPEEWIHGGRSERRMGCECCETFCARMWGGVDTVGVHVASPHWWSSAALPHWLTHLWMPEGAV